MLIKNSCQVIFYHSHFDRGPNRDTNINFKTNFLLYDFDSFVLLKQRIDTNNIISKILNKSFGNWISSKKYDYL